MRQQATLRGLGDPRLLLLSTIAWTTHAALQCIVGAFIGASYHTSSAYESAAALHAHQPAAVLQAFHYWGSAILILHAVLHGIVTFGFGQFGREFKLYGLAALAMIVVSMGFQITGNLLPHDKHGVQTAAIEAGITARIPVVGAPAANLAFGGTTASDSTLTRWFQIHTFLPLGVLVVFALAYSLNKKQWKGFWTVSALLPTAIALIFAIAIRSPLGSAATPNNFSEYLARASWYTWPLHGSMHLFDAVGSNLGWVGSAVVPAIFGICAFAALFAKAGAKWPRLATALCASYFALAALFFGGKFASLTGTRDPVDTTPQQPSTQVAPINRALMSSGHVLFNSQCAGCHGRDGLNGDGGPSLATEFKKHSDAAWYLTFIRDPAKVHPSSTMPAFPNLKVDELKALAEYLRSPR